MVLWSARFRKEQNFEEIMTIIFLNYLSSSPTLFNCKRSVSHNISGYICHNTSDIKVPHEVGFVCSLSILLIKRIEEWQSRHNAWKVSVFWVIPVRIFRRSDQNNSKYGHFLCSVIFIGKRIQLFLIKLWQSQSWLFKVISFAPSLPNWSFWFFSSYLQQFPKYMMLCAI